MGTVAAAKALPFSAKLKRRENVAEGTMAFFFERPAGFVFAAGQFIDIELQSPAETDDEGNTRTYSISSAPQDDTIMVTTRLRDTAFKRVLKTMPLETEVKIEGPSGDLRLHKDAARAAVFLAGGIGITPFRSILSDAANRYLSHPIFLFFSNRRPKDAPFLAELQSLEKRSANFTCIATMTAPSESSGHRHGERGFINKEMLDKHLKNAPSPIYYIAGPPVMVNALQAMLREAGIGHNDIRAEEFAGY